MLHSRARPSRLVPNRKPDTPMPDPYAPSSPAYAERHRETVREIAPGLTRVDIGEPVQ